MFDEMRETGRKFGDAGGYVVDLIYVMFVDVYGRLVAGDTVTGGSERDERRQRDTERVQEQKRQGEQRAKEASYRR